MARQSDESTPRHPMGVVTQRTGLSPDVLRVWEKRYRVVEPARSEGGHRLYSDADLERLKLLHQATMGGRGIGRVASLSNEDLAELVREDAQAARLARQAESQSGRAQSALPLTQYLSYCLARVESLDDRGLECTLRQAALTLSAGRLVSDLLGPLMWEIGERWHRGALGTQHEHMASAVVRRVLDWVGSAFSVNGDSPRIVVSTPQGQSHELGAMFAAATAQAEGWRVTYLGPDLPAEDIAAAAAQTSARAVALSLVFPEGDAAVTDQLSRLAAALPVGVELLVGGSAEPSYRPVLERIGATRLDDQEQLRHALRRLTDDRSGAKGGTG